MVYRHYNEQHGIRAVVFWDHIGWVAIGLEKDIAAQGPDREEAQRRFDIALDGEKAVLAERRAEGLPAQEIGPSPERYHFMWDQAA